MGGREGHVPPRPTSAEPLNTERLRWKGETGARERGGLTSVTVALRGHVSSPIHASKLGNRTSDARKRTPHRASKFRKAKHLLWILRKRQMVVERWSRRRYIQHQNTSASVCFSSCQQHSKEKLQLHQFLPPRSRFQEWPKAQPSRSDSVCWWDEIRRVERACVREEGGPAGGLGRSNTTTIKVSREKVTANHREPQGTPFTSNAKRLTSWRVSVTG